VFVRTVRLYAPSDGVSIDAATVRLYPDTSRSTASAVLVSGPVVEGGTDIGFGDVASRVVRIEFTRVRGPHTSLAEIEVIAATTVGTGPPPPPVVDPPTNLRVDSLRGNTVRLRWKAPSGVTPDGYVVEGGLAPGQTIAIIPVGALTMLQLATPTGRYYVRVRAMKGGVRSAPSNEVIINPGLVVTPSAPTDLLGLTDGDIVQLSWRTTFDGGGLSAIRLYVNGVLAATLPPSAERFSYHRVPAGSYSVVLQAVGLDGSPGASSPPLSLTLPGPCAGPPLPPSGLLAYRDANRVVAMWDPPASGPAHAGYVLDVSGAYTGSLPVGDRTISGVVGPGAYTLNVRAVNQCGSSTPSAAQTVVVP
jgi:hypothetical protein